MKLKTEKTVETISALLIFLFFYTAISKYLDLHTFTFSLNMAPLLKPYASFISYFLPALEIGIGMLLILPKTRKFGLYASCLLLMIFTAYLTYMVTFSKELPCGCGGVISIMTWQQHIVFNLIFLSISIIGLYTLKSLEKITQSLKKTIAL